ncbi:MAG: low molecular weight phosphotyrosine protein phosphatase [Lachnospiraceae bacterium]|jgi:protein-tyrosine phosphatase|nr:low molecular weight phosphotyrosine protein phosphatase [Lachnospiraceae bacterium]
MGKDQKTKILFICHGNICRSPMAEFVMKDMVAKAGIGEHYFIASAATSTEELGNPVYPGTRKRLAKEGISVAGKTGIQIRRSDYEEYDFLIGMDTRNINNMMRVFGSDPEEKVQRLLDYTDSPADIADPWYTGDFDTTYDDVVAGCTALLKLIEG